MQYPLISEYVKAIQDAGDNLDMSTEATNAELNEAITDEFGVKYSKDGRKLLQASKELDGTYSIRKGTKIVCDRAFSGCRSLNCLVISDSVTSIGTWAFAYCESLKSLVIPASVTSIGGGAFCGCRSLSSLVIPDSVTSIGDSTFSYCESLRSLVIPNSVGNIIGNPFSGWNGELKCLSPYFIYDNKVLFDKDKNAIISFRDKDTTSYIIPDYITSIGDSAFEDCSSLRSVVFPDSVTSIGNRAFNECDSLRSVVIPDGVTSIGIGAFIGCKSLKSLEIPDSVTSIGFGAFSYCYFPYKLKQELISRFGEKIFG